MDRDALLHSRGTKCPSDASSLSLMNSEGAGNAGCRPHPWPACNKKRRRQSPQVRRNIAAFPAQWFERLIRALSGAPGLLATIASRDHHPRNLTPASGGQDHAISPYVRAHSSARRSALSRHVHRIPRSTSVTIAIRPSGEGGTRGYNHDFPKNGRRIFFMAGLDMTPEYRK